jgi:hypothetical protein
LHTLGEFYKFIFTILSKIQKMVFFQNLIIIPDTLKQKRHYSLILPLPLDQWEGGITSNTTMIVPITGHFDVSLIAPCGAPGILDEPVVLAIAFSSKANDKYSVIIIPRVTTSVEVNATSIQLE